jgi:transposase
MTYERDVWVVRRQSGFVDAYIVPVEDGVRMVDARRLEAAEARIRELEQHD